MARGFSGLITYVASQRRTARGAHATAAGVSTTSP